MTTPARKPFHWGRKAGKNRGRFPVAMNVRLSHAQATELRRWAHKRRLSVSEAVRDMIAIGIGKDKSNG